jgi:hypothetical protein
MTRATKGGGGRSRAVARLATQVDPTTKRTGVTGVRERKPGTTPFSGLPTPPRRSARAAHCRVAHCDAATAVRCRCPASHLMHSCTCRRTSSRASHNRTKSAIGEGYLNGQESSEREDHPAKLPTRRFLDPGRHQPRPTVLPSPTLSGGICMSHLRPPAPADDACSPTLREPDVADTGCAQRQIPPVPPLPNNV